MLSAGDPGPRGGTIPAHHTAQACRQASFGRRPEAAPHAFGSGRQPRRPGGCGDDRPPRGVSGRRAQRAGRGRRRGTDGLQQILR